MPGIFHHEATYRGGDSLAKIAVFPIALCGAGALGSHLADNLARQGFQKLRVIDRDRVDEHNVGTQLYGRSDVGGWKVELLRNQLFRSTGIEIDAVRKELTERNIRGLLESGWLVIDAFDNSAARGLVQRHCRTAGLCCLHVGLFADYGEVIWDEVYRVPRDVSGDVCDYPLARNLVLLTVAVASETAIRSVLTGERANWTITLRDFAVRGNEGP